MTVIALIERCSARLTEAGVSFGHGTDNAFDEAAWLVLWRLGLALDDLDAVAEQAVTAEQQAAVQALLDERIAASIACHGAVRAGKVLTADEMSQLVRDLEKAESPLNCPHGRPTMVHFTTSHLEREFGRSS